MIDHDDVYRQRAEQYERLIAREDAEGNLLRTIRDIVPDLSKSDVADIGAGTGRLARLLAPHVRSVQLFDASQAMLDVAAKLLLNAGQTNWQVKQALNDALPMGDEAVDLLTAGWTICYSASRNVPDWRLNLQAILTEIERVLKPGGTAIIFENFGTGVAAPNPPDFLIPYYHELEKTYGFNHSYIRTDFRFGSPAEAQELIDFFFGSEFTAKLSVNAIEFPECNGVWWKSF